MALVKDDFISALEADPLPPEQMGLRVMPMDQDELIDEDTGETDWVGLMELFDELYGMREILGPQLDDHYGGDFAFRVIAKHHWLVNENIVVRA